MANPKRKNPQSTAVSYYDSAGDTYPDVSSANPLPITIVSGSSSGTEYTEDAAAAANPVGGALIVVRQDTPGTLVTTDGDNVAVRGTNYGAAYVQVVNSTGSFVDTFGGGSQYTEDAAAAANPVGTAVNLIRQDTPAGLTTTDGDNVAQRGTNYGAGYVQVLTSAGAFVDTFGGGTQYTQGDTDASITGTAMLMEVAADTLQPVQGTVADGLLVNLGANNDVSVTGAAANGAAVSGNPVLIGGEDPSGNVARLQTATDGDLVVHQHSAATVLADAVSNTMHIPVNQTDTGFLGTPVAGYVYNGTTWDRERGDATNGTLVNLGANNDVTVTGTVTEANSAAIAASLSVLDDWDETNRAAVNTIAGQVGVQGGSGAVSALTQRVVLATDVALPAGTNAIGKLAANSGVDIGDVDITSIAAGTNIIGRVGHDITGIGNGVTTVTTAGTDVALAASTACKRVVIQAQTDNTSGIAVGTSGVDATVATGTGIYLNPGDAFELEIDNLADIFIDSLVSGEGVRYTYFV